MTAPTEEGTVELPKFPLTIADVHDAIRDAGGVWRADGSIVLPSAERFIAAAVLCGEAPCRPRVGQQGEETTALHSTMDAMVWAKEFCRLFPGNDEGLMLTWFANAIMVGWDHAHRIADRASRSPVVGAVGGEPLTEEQALAAARKALDGPDATDEDYGPNTLNMVWFRTICLPIVRAVEAFHGIGVSPTGSALTEEELADCGLLSELDGQQEDPGK